MHRTATKIIVTGLTAGTLLLSGLSVSSGRVSAHSLRAGAQFIAPSGVAVDRHGTVYVSDLGDHSVKRMSASGAVTAVWKSGLHLEGSAPLTVDSKGNVFVLDSVRAATGSLDHTIVKLSSSGRVISHLINPALQGAVDFALIGHGGVVATVPQQPKTGNPFTQLVEVSCKDKVLRSWVVSKSRYDFTVPIAVTTDAKHTIYAAVAAGSCTQGCQGYSAVLVEHYSLKGKRLTIRSLAPSGVTGLAVNRKGNLYLAEVNGVAAISSKGKKVGTWGTVGCGPRQFRGVVSLALDTRGNVYLADQYNHNVQKLSAKGGALALWGGCPSSSSPGSPPPPPPLPKATAKP